MIINKNNNDTNNHYYHFMLHGTLCSTVNVIESTKKAKTRGRLSALIRFSTCIDFFLLWIWFFVMCGSHVVKILHIILW